MMSAEDWEAYRKLLEEVNHEISSGHVLDESRNEFIRDADEKVKKFIHYCIILADMVIPREAKPIAVSGRWWRSSPLKFLATPLGTESSRLHRGRFNQSGVGALYITNDPETAAAERQLSIKPDNFYTFQVEINLQKVLDISNADACKVAGVIDKIMTGIEWQYQLDIMEMEEPYTHALGRIARANFFEGILFESVRKSGTYNLAIFPELLRLNSFIRVHDMDQTFAHLRPEDLCVEGLSPLD